jgi:SAM-dependent methyltransferase
VTARRRREWFDDDSFWRDLYPTLFSAARVASAIEDTGRLIRLVRPKGRAVLDLCCGPGRFSIPLAKRGYKVTGVDRTRYYLAKARAGARSARVTVEWVRRDMRDFVRPGAFDLALSMFTSFGYFDDKEEDLRVLRNVLLSLKPGGAFVIETLGKELLARIFAPATAQTLPGGALLVQRHAVMDDWTRIRNDWTLVRRGRAKTYTFHHTIFSGQELRDRMEQAGFADVKLYGSLAGAEYGLNAQRLIAVGRRPGPAGRAGPGRRAAAKVR